LGGKRYGSKCRNDVFSERKTMACPFDAIHIVDGIALVDKEVCKACGKCVA
jgi:Fe-S-cluster-containing hydrogenase component 2